MEGIIFDFNGTMFMDSMLHEQAWGEFIYKHTNHKLSEAEILEHIHGHNNQYILKKFINEFISDDDFTAMENEKETIYRNLCLSNQDNLTLTNGLVELLDKLKANNVPITIATASPKVNLDFYQELFDLDKWFDLDKIVYNDGTFKGKPEPDIFLKAANKIGVDITKCIVIEDALSGVEAARRANAGKIIAIGKDKAQFINKPEVSEIIEDFTEFKF